MFGKDNDTDQGDGKPKTDEKTEGIGAAPTGNGATTAGSGQAPKKPEEVAVKKEEVGDDGSARGALVVALQRLQDEASDGEKNTGLSKAIVHTRSAIDNYDRG